jgi:ABC-type polysaccharide/polyol phosphate transport system ATPase subunit
VTAPPPVVVDGVSKDFRLPRERVHTLKERALHPLRRTRDDVLHALRDVSFAVEPGEFFGIVGRNGSGKSTLLKCLAGIYAVDRGDIYVNGRMSTFIELGVGFNPDLPARDNVALNATMLGLTPREADRRFDEIIDFAELRDFTEVKLKNYSSGMLVRLAFSVMIQVDAEILLIDEVLAVGDAAFQQKCFDEFARIKRSGATVLFVTHDMGAVQRFCDRAMLLEHGRIVELGATERVGNRYLELNFSQEARRELGETPERAPGEEPDALPPPSAARIGDGRGEVLDAWFEDEAGERTETVQQHGRCRFVMRTRFHEQVEDPLFGLALQDVDGHHVFAASNKWAGEGSGSFAAGQEAVVRIAFDAHLAPGRYLASPAIARDGAAGAWIDWRERMVDVVVTALRSHGGLAEIPFALEIERVGGEVPTA